MELKECAVCGKKVEVRYPWHECEGGEALPLEMDSEMRGRIVEDRRYLGDGKWQKVNVEESRLNE